MVIACNTATSAAASVVREKYNIPIIGIEPAVKPAVKNSNGKRVLVIATPLTVAEKKLQDLVARVDDDHLVDLLALPGLVSFAENDIFEVDKKEIVSFLRKKIPVYMIPAEFIYISEFTSVP